MQELFSCSGLGSPMVVCCLLLLFFLLSFLGLIVGCNQKKTVGLLVRFLFDDELTWQLYIFEGQSLCLFAMNKEVRVTEALSSSARISFCSTHHSSSLKSKALLQLTSTSRRFQL